MASYEELDSLIGPLKRAAIDAYMRSDGWGPWKWEIKDDHYLFVHTTTGSMFGPTTEEVTRPDASGEGGGDWRMRVPMAPDPDQEPGKYAPEFNEVRSRIDEALRRWKYLPEPGDIGELVEALRQANRTLALGSVSSNGTVTGGGTIGGNINLIMENSDAMAGGMITAFKSDFLAQLANAIGGHHAITVVLGSMVAAEQRIWEGAQQTVADTVVDSTEAFKAAADQGDLSWDVVLKVAGFAVAGAAIFASGGAATALAVAGLGIKVLDGAVPDEATWLPTQAPGGDFDSVMNTFEDTLDNLAKAIETEEQILDDNLSTNLEQVHSDQSSYDLSRPPIIDIDDDSDLGRPEELRIDPVLVKEITETFLPAIADELAVAGTHLNDAVSLSPLLRDSSIGLGQYGPSESYYPLRYLTYELIKNLQVEIKWSAEALQLGVEDMRVVDTGASDALEKHAKEVRDLGIGQPDSPYNPWN